MNCRELVEFLDAYVEGTLEEGQRSVFEGHVSDCADCQRYVASYRATVKAEQCLCEELEGGLPADVPDELVRAILEARRRR